MTREIKLTLKEVVTDHIHTTLLEEDWQSQPSISEALEVLTAAQAAWKPGPERHSIWQIVRHLILWKRAVLDAWNGNPPDGDQLGAIDWKAVRGSEADWQNDRQTLLDISNQFLARAQALGEAELSRNVVWYESGASQPYKARVSGSLPDHITLAHPSQRRIEGRRGGKVYGHVASGILYCDASSES